MKMLSLKSESSILWILQNQSRENYRLNPGIWGSGEIGSRLLTVRLLPLTNVSAG